MARSWDATRSCSSCVCPSAARSAASGCCCRAAARAASTYRAGPPSGAPLPPGALSASRSSARLAPQPEQAHSSIYLLHHTCAAASTVTRAHSPLYHAHRYALQAQVVLTLSHQNLLA